MHHSSGGHAPSSAVKLHFLSGVRREDNKFFSSKKKKLTKKIAAELLDKGWCRVTGLYTPKRPQLYDAVIRLDDTGGKYVSFKMEFDR